MSKIKLYIIIYFDYEIAESCPLLVKFLIYIKKEFFTSYLFVVFIIFVIYDIHYLFNLRTTCKKVHQPA